MQHTGKRHSIFILFFMLLYFGASAEWLSDKGNGTTGTLQKNGRGFYKPVLSPDKFPKVSLLYAVKEQEKPTIKLHWQDSKSTAEHQAANLQYVIYRSGQMIDSESKLNKAEKLALIDNGIKTYLDSQLKPGKYYYAITVIDKKQIEYFKPEYAQTYTVDEITIKKPVITAPTNKTPQLPGTIINLKASYDKSKNQIKLKWDYKNNKRPGLLIIHRNISPISTGRLISESTILKRTLPNQGYNSLTISQPDSMTNYFAILTHNQAGTNTTINPGQNSLTQPVIIQQDKGIKKITRYITNEIIYNIYKTNHIHITNTRYQTNTVTLNVTNRVPLYLSSTNYITNYIETIKTNTVTIDKFQTNINYLTNFQVIDTFQTNNVTLTNYQTNTIDIIQFNTNTRTITRTQIVTNKQTVTVPDSYDDNNSMIRKLDNDSALLNLRSAIRRFYAVQNSGSKTALIDTARRLSQIEQNTDNNAIKYQCILYRGRAYFRMGAYTAAFKEFVKLKNIFPDESRGWINRCLNHMN